MNLEDEKSWSFFMPQVKLSLLAGILLQQPPGLGGCLSEAKAGGFIYSRKAHTRLTDKTIPAQMTQNFRELASPRGSWPRRGGRAPGRESEAAEG